jgi:hypothetical protein
MRKHQLARQTATKSDLFAINAEVMPLGRLVLGEQLLQLTDRRRALRPFISPIHATAHSDLLGAGGEGIAAIYEDRRRTVEPKSRGILWRVDQLVLQ